MVTVNKWIVYYAAHVKSGGRFAWVIKDPDPFDQDHGLFLVNNTPPKWL